MSVVEVSHPVRSEEPGSKLMPVITVSGTEPVCHGVGLISLVALILKV